MKLTIQVKLIPSDVQRAKLLATMRTFNAACNHLAGIAVEHHTAGKFNIQKLAYRDIRNRFGLSAQLTIRAIAKVCEAYKRDKRLRPAFKEFGAIVYDQRILSWKGLERVSLLTTQGRERIPIVLGPYQQARLDRIRGQADLVYRDREFYLATVVEVDDAAPLTPKGTLGVDLGLVNLATDSDGDLHSGAQVEHVRTHYAAIKVPLQRRGTKSAKRHLKKVSGREARFRRNTNHVISKHLVAKATDTHRQIALEDLEGIRQRAPVRKAQRGRHHAWGFHQLRSFIEYKATRAGVPVRLVDPRNTSRTCPTCGCIDKRNRHQQTFECVTCGYAGHADHVAAMNIAARAPVNAPIVSEEILTHLGSPSGTSPPASAVGR